MKILLTGANGFVGRQLCHRLLNEGFSVVPLVQKKIGLSGEVVVDFDGDELASVLKDLPAMEVVVHLASKIDFSTKIADLYRANILATAQLAAFAREHGLHFIFASSVSVCGIASEKIDLGTAENPDTAYGYSKWLGEKIVFSSGVDGLILRISGIFGRGGGYHLGLNRALDNAARGTVPVLVGDGLGKRNYVYVDDLLEMIVDAIKKRILGLHYAAGREQLSVKQMLEEICKTFLPGENIVHKDPKKPSRDQVVVPSRVLYRGRSFREAIENESRVAG